MKYSLILILDLGSLFLISEAAVSIAVGQSSSRDRTSTPSSITTSSTDSIDIYGKDFYLANSDFKCPFIFGAFADPYDCRYFYLCMAGRAVHKKCPVLQHFDAVRMICMSALVAICGKNKDRTSTPSGITTSSTDSIEENFKCPSFMGFFSYQNDCSKYYSCMIYLPKLKTCPENQLFDAVKNACKPENEVNCGDRPRPGITTTTIPTESITTKTSEEIITKVTTETTTEVISTTTYRPIGPPPHNCTEDDVDCIITETGDVEDWFICPQDVGSFVHPSSDKLFIFCMNWIPSAKKCGQNLVFSKELSTCTEITDFI